jgi:hypothetical protein
MNVTQHRPRQDTAHHHPTVRRGLRGDWVWECHCGGASGRAAPPALTWHQAVVGALNHATCIAP